MIVLTAGVDAPGDMSRARSGQAAAAVQLQPQGRDRDPEFGQAGDFHALQQVASATDGAAYQILSPNEIGKVFIQAISRRI